jgi:hypothetical protein
MKSGSKSVFSVVFVPWVLTALSLSSLIFMTVVFVAWGENIGRPSQGRFLPVVRIIAVGGSLLALPGAYLSGPRYLKHAAKYPTTLFQQPPRHLLFFLGMACALAPWYSGIILYLGFGSQLAEYYVFTAISVFAVALWVLFWNHKYRYHDDNS